MTLDRTISYSSLHQLWTPSNENRSFPNRESSIECEREREYLHCHLHMWELHWLLPTREDEWYGIVIVSNWLKKGKDVRTTVILAESNCGDKIKGVQLTDSRLCLIRDTMHYEGDLEYGKPGWSSSVQRSKINCQPAHLELSCSSIPSRRVECRFD